MNTIFSARIMKRLALTTALCTAFISAAHADDLNIKTMIPGVPQIDAESYILIDYNSGKVLAEQNADVRRDPASIFVRSIGATARYPARETAPGFALNACHRGKV